MPITIKPSIIVPNTINDIQLSNPYIAKKYVALPVYKVMPVLLVMLFSVVGNCLI